MDWSAITFFVRHSILNGGKCPLTLSIIFFFPLSRVFNFTYLFILFLDCTNLNSFLLCLHKWHFLVECTMDLVETVIGVKALSILLAYWKDGISVCSSVDRSESAVFHEPSSAPLKVSVCFLWHVKHLCMCVWGVFRPVHLPLISWYQKQSSLPGITVLFRIRDCDSCIWKWYLECYCCHQWNMQVFISPHTTFELWAICSAVPKNVSLLIFGSGFVFCLTSRSQYLLFLCKF